MEETSERQWMPRAEMAPLLGKEGALFINKEVAFWSF